MSDTKSLFRTLAFETHPDRGGDAARFREVVKVQTDFASLVTLANRWGIKIDGIPNTSAGRAALEAIVGAIIRHGFTYKRKSQVLYGVIVNIRTITKGYSKGAREFKIFDLRAGTIWTLKSREIQPFDEVVTMADISQLNEGQEKIERMKQFTKMKKLAKQNEADSHFDRIGLFPGKSYRHDGINVLVEYKGGKMEWETLLRTTPKSVYILKYGYKNDERRIPVSSILQKKKSW